VRAEGQTAELPPPAKRVSAILPIVTWPTPTGEREINPEEAAVIRRIFEQHVAGVSSKQMAKTLNREGVRGPQGALWSPSTIHGNPKRGIGMLNNELYIARPGLEPTAVCERPGHRETPGAVESAVRVRFVGQFLQEHGVHRAGRQL
jgi:hypothetical protein